MTDYSVAPKLETLGKILSRIELAFKELKAVYIENTRYRHTQCDWVTIDGLSAWLNGISGYMAEHREETERLTELAGFPEPMICGPDISPRWNIIEVATWFEEQKRNQDALKALTETPPKPSNLFDAFSPFRGK